MHTLSMSVDGDAHATTWLTTQYTDMRGTLNQQPETTIILNRIDTTREDHATQHTSPHLPISFANPYIATRSTWQATYD